ncbi:outer membrane beta-barrel protein [Thalassomonas sp. M1454]|uniref:outer membrane beta-barrel protein n=1 Tax=Thalassomonas sp. M1454 TaxID=2594477 RepID=UPI00117F624E|nr:outer membrane beta-barrel protein [Thalassomonas sp. M1454]TRX57163.1 porin family protein [Thalassomonas sp. M1454]
MNKLLATSLTLTSLLITQQVNAKTTDSNIFQPNEKLYLGAMVQSNLYNEDSKDDLEANSVIARLGYNYNQNMAVELRLGTSLDADNIGGIESEMDSLAGIYLVGTMPINRTLSVYALMGATSTEFTKSYQGYSETDTLSGVSMGAGINIRLMHQVALNLELVNYVDKETAFGGLSAGVKVSF